MVRKILQVAAGVAIALALFAWFRPAAPAGAQTDGVRGYRRFERQVIRTVSGSAELLRECLPQQVILGGGCASYDPSLTLLKTYPSRDETLGGVMAWACEWAGDATDARLVAYALCADQ